MFFCFARFVRCPSLPIADGVTSAVITCKLTLPSDQTVAIPGKVPLLVRAILVADSLLSLELSFDVDESGSMCTSH